MNFSGDIPWVIFRLLDQHYGISTTHIKEMVAMPRVVCIPRMPPYVRGVINLRGQVFPVIDLRLRLGMKSLSAETNELIQLLEQREQDHENWIAELESSVKEKRDFKLTTDPHQCAFGKWYDHYHTKNQILAFCLKKFDAPHKKIHAIASRVKELQHQKKYALALNLIEDTKNGDLAEMVQLFADARSLLIEEIREIALILEWKEISVAVSVDSVETVERLPKCEIESLPRSICKLNNDCIGGFGKRSNGKSLVQLMDVGKVVAQEALAALQAAQEA